MCLYILFVKYFIHFIIVIVCEPVLALQKENKGAKIFPSVVTVLKTLSSTSLRSGWISVPALLFSGFYYDVHRDDIGFQCLVAVGVRGMDAHETGTTDDAAEIASIS